MDTTKAGSRNWCIPDFSQLKTKLKLPYPVYNSNATHVDVKHSPVRNGSPFHLDQSTSRIPSPAHQPLPSSSVDSVRKASLSRISSSESLSTEDQPLDLSKRRKVDTDNVAPLDLSVKKEVQDDWSTNTERSAPSLSSMGSMLNVPFSPVRPNDNSHRARGRSQNLFDSIGTVVSSAASPVRRISPVRPHIRGVPVVTSPCASSSIGANSESASQMIILPGKRTHHGIVAGQKTKNAKFSVVISSTTMSPLHHSGPAVSQATSPCKTVLNVPTRVSPKAQQMAALLRRQFVSEPRPMAQVRPNNTVIKPVATTSVPCSTSVVNHVQPAPQLVGLASSAPAPCVLSPLPVQLHATAAQDGHTSGRILPPVSDKIKDSVLSETREEKCVKRKTNRKPSAAQGMASTEASLNVILHQTCSDSVIARNSLVNNDIVQNSEITVSIALQNSLCKKLNQKTEDGIPRDSSHLSNTRSSPFERDAYATTVASQSKIISKLDTESYSVSLDSTISSLAQKLGSSSTKSCELNCAPTNVKTVLTSPISCDKVCKESGAESPNKTTSPRKKSAMSQDTSLSQESSPKKSPHRKRKSVDPKQSAFSPMTVFSKKAFLKSKRTFFSSVAFSYRKKHSKHRFDIRKSRYYKSQVMKQGNSSWSLLPQDSRAYFSKPKVASQTHPPGHYEFVQSSRDTWKDDLKSYKTKVLRLPACLVYVPKTTPKGFTIPQKDELETIALSKGSAEKLKPKTKKMKQDEFSQTSGKIKGIELPPDGQKIKRCRKRKAKLLGEEANADKNLQVKSQKCSEHKPKITLDQNKYKPDIHHSMQNGQDLSPKLDGGNVSDERKTLLKEGIQKKVRSSSVEVQPGDVKRSSVKDLTTLDEYQPKTEPQKSKVFTISHVGCLSQLQRSKDNKPLGPRDEMASISNIGATVHIRTHKQARKVLSPALNLDLVTSEHAQFAAKAYANFDLTPVGMPPGLKAEVKTPEQKEQLPATEVKPVKQVAKKSTGGLRPKFPKKKQLCVPDHKAVAKVKGSSPGVVVIGSSDDEGPYSSPESVEYHDSVVNTPLKDFCSESPKQKLDILTKLDNCVTSIENKEKNCFSFVRNIDSIINHTLQKSPSVSPIKRKSVVRMLSPKRINVQNSPTNDNRPTKSPRTNDSRPKSPRLTEIRPKSPGTSETRQKSPRSQRFSPIRRDGSPRSLRESPKKKKCKNRKKRSLLDELANTDGYVADKRTRHCEDLLVDPSQLSREERALQRAFIKFTEMEIKQNEPRRGATKGKELWKAKVESCAFRKAKQLKRQAMMGKEQRASLKKAMKRTKGFVDFVPKILDSRLRHGRRAENFARNQAKLKANAAKKLDFDPKCTSTPVQLQNILDDKQKPKRTCSGSTKVKSTLKTPKGNKNQKTSSPLKGEGSVKALYSMKPKVLIQKMKSPKRKQLMKKARLLKADSPSMLQMEEGERPEVYIDRDVYDPPEIYSEQSQQPIQPILAPNIAPDDDARSVASTATSSGHFKAHVPTEVKKIAICYNTGETVLHKAARLGYEDVCRWCCENDYVKVNAPDNAGYTALHESCAYGHVKIAKCLLEHGGDFNVASRLDGVRPLLDAVENGHMEIVRLLLACGADPFLTTYSGKNAFRLARTREMKDFLSAYMLDMNGLTGNEKETPWDICQFRTWPLGEEDEEEEEAGFDVLANIPEDEPDISDMLEFEMWDEPPIMSYNICVDSTKGHKNYAVLHEVLSRLSLTKEDLLAKHKDIEVENISVADFRGQLSALQEEAAEILLSEWEEPVIQLVSMCDQLRKLLDVEVEKIDFCTPKQIKVISTLSKLQENPARVSSPSNHVPDTNSCYVTEAHVALKREKPESFQTDSQARVGVQQKRNVTSIKPSTTVIPPVKTTQLLSTENTELNTFQNSQAPKVFPLSLKSMTVCPRPDVLTASVPAIRVSNSVCEQTEDSQISLEGSNGQPFQCFSMCSPMVGASSGSPCVPGSIYESPRSRLLITQPEEPAESYGIRITRVCSLTQEPSAQESPTEKSLFQ